jgi:hypothetical protein|tara:strand:+ start:530 stop:778 length:249 start_codon:yes stop_codon:yes gene_type:complete
MACLALVDFAAERKDDCNEEEAVSRLAQPRAGVREHRSRLVASIENVQKGNGAEWLRPQDRRIIKALSSSVAVGAQSTLQWC